MHTASIILSSCSALHSAPFESSAVAPQCDTTLKLIDIISDHIFSGLPLPNNRLDENVKPFLDHLSCLSPKLISGLSNEIFMAVL